MNRHLSYAIVYSPADKDNIKHNYQDTLKVLNKNCEKFIIAYEEGKLQTNPHLDIVAVFKSKQARADLNKKFHFLGKKPEVVYSVINDLEYRIGYNQKEKQESPFNHIFNFTVADLESSTEHFLQEEESRRVQKKKYSLFTYIKESSFAYEYNKYILSHKLEEPQDQKSYEIILKEMYLAGYIFTTIKKSSLQIIGRQIISVYRHKNDPNYELEKDGKISNLSLTDLEVTDVSSPEAHSYCSQCLSKF